MDNQKQERLITIKNLCESFSITVEKHFNEPDNVELLRLVKELREECHEYLKPFLL